MSYATQAAMAQDEHLHLRVAACAATQGVSGVLFWASQNQWTLSAQPGWDQAYASAVASGIDRPGLEESVISDGMILSSLQLLLPKDSA